MFEIDRMSILSSETRNAVRYWPLLIKYITMNVSIVIHKCQLVYTSCKGVNQFPISLKYYRSMTMTMNDNENMFITIDLHVYKIQDARYVYIHIYIYIYTSVFLYIMATWLKLAWASDDWEYSQYIFHNCVDGLGQDCSISSALTMEIVQSYTKPSTFLVNVIPYRPKRCLSKTIDKSYVFVYILTCIMPLRDIW